MGSTIAAITVVLAMNSTGGLLHRDGNSNAGNHRGFFHRGGGKIVPPGPGLGWGWPNGNPDGYGWVDYGDALPLGDNRTAEYYFPRYLASQPQQIFFPQYYNAYVDRGERYIPYANCGGAHPMGGPPMAPASTPLHPYNDTISAGIRVPVPTFSGRVEAAPVNPGSSGLTP